MNLKYFQEEIHPLLKKFNIQYSSFSGGDLGDCDRAELEGFNKFATIDFWSMGWIGIDIYDCNIDKQIMNTIIPAHDSKIINETFENFIRNLNVR